MRAYGGNEKPIEIKQSFRSHQMGDFFGYALVAGDFNDDGVCDLVIAAPFHCWHRDSYDNGAVYVYRRVAGQDRLSLSETLRATYQLDGRFGLAITNVGDIDRDGFNGNQSGTVQMNGCGDSSGGVFADLAIGAPYEGDGAVYIYYGSSTGLLARRAQRIASPAQYTARPMLFGFSISKGIDTDDNGFLGNTQE